MDSDNLLADPYLIEARLRKLIGDMSNHAFGYVPTEIKNELILNQQYLRRTLGASILSNYPSRIRTGIIFLRPITFVTTSIIHVEHSWVLAKDDLQRVSSDFQCFVCGAIFSTDQDKRQHLQKESHREEHEGSTIEDMEIAQHQTEVSEAHRQKYESTA